MKRGELSELPKPRFHGSVSKILYRVLLKRRKGLGGDPWGGIFEGILEQDDASVTSGSPRVARENILIKVAGETNRAQGLR